MNKETVITSAFIVQSSVIHSPAALLDGLFEHPVMIQTTVPLEVY